MRRGNKGYILNTPRNHQRFKRLIAFCLKPYEIDKTHYLLVIFNAMPVAGRGAELRGKPVI